MTARVAFGGGVLVSAVSVTGLMTALQRSRVRESEIIQLWSYRSTQSRKPNNPSPNPTQSLTIIQTFKTTNVSTILITTQWYVCDQTLRASDPDVNHYILSNRRGYGALGSSSGGFTAYEHDGFGVLTCSQHYQW